MRSRTGFALLVALAALPLPAAAAPPPKAPKTIEITPHITWSERGLDCPGGTRDLEKRTMPVPERGESATEIWFADYPICASRASKSCGINRQANSPRFPIFLHKEVECLVGANGEKDRSCTPMGDVCRSRFTVVLTSEERCECSDLRVSGRRGKVNISDPDLRGRTHLRLTLDWDLFCVQQPGVCEGEFDFVVPRVWQLKYETPTKIPVSCDGKCDPGPDAPFLYTSFVRFHATSGKPLGSRQRAGRELNILVREFCFKQDGERVLAGTTKIRIVFRVQGFVDLTRSDIDGDGIADGKQRKKKR